MKKEICEINIQLFLGMSLMYDFDDLYGRGIIMFPLLSALLGDIMNHSILVGIVPNFISNFNRV